MQLGILPASRGRLPGRSNVPSFTGRLRQVTLPSNLAHPCGVKHDHSHAIHPLPVAHRCLAYQRTGNRMQIGTPATRSSIPAPTAIPTPTIPGTTISSPTLPRSLFTTRCPTAPRRCPLRLRCRPPMPLWTMHRGQMRWMQYRRALQTRRGMHANPRRHDLCPRGNARCAPRPIASRWRPPIWGGASPLEEFPGIFLAFCAFRPPLGWRTATSYASFPSAFSPLYPWHPSCSSQRRR